MTRGSSSSASARYLPSFEAVSLVALAVLSFALKYLTAIVLANALGIDDYKLYAVPIGSVTLCSTLVELGLGKQGIRLLPEYIETGEHELAAGYWRFAMRAVLLCALVVGVLASLQETLLPGLGAIASDEAMYLLPVVALTGVGAELVIACGAAVLATIVVRVGIPGVLLLGVVLLREPTPAAAVLTYGASWLIAGVVLFAAFVITVPRAVLRGPSRFEGRMWLRSALGFLGVALAISALVDGTVALTEFAAVPAADISIYAVCIETGAFVLILVKSLDKFYLQQISALLSHRDVAEIRRIRGRRTLLMSAICTGFCLLIFIGGRQLLGNFGAGFERGYVALCCIAVATSVWTLASLSQWLIAFMEGPARAFRISIAGVVAVYASILLLGPSQGLMGVALSYAVMVLVMSVRIELRARMLLRELESKGPVGEPEAQAHQLNSLDASEGLTPAAITIDTNKPKVT